MKVITINQRAILKNNLKSIDDVNEYLKNMGVECLVISAERNTLEHNYHYHVLANKYNEEVERNLWLNAIYNDDLQNETGYFEYITKEGNYKLFNGYEPVFKSKTKNQYELMLNDIYINNLGFDDIRIKYPVLFVRHFSTIRKMIFGD